MTRSRILSALSRLLRGGAARRAVPPAGKGAGTAYPGDFRGRVDVRWSPRHDDRADPGEIVWAWVPFEEDHGRGKDRPVLVVGRDGRWLLALMLTSKDHDRDAADEARWGRQWCRAVAMTVSGDHRGRRGHRFTFAHRAVVTDARG